MSYSIGEIVNILPEMKIDVANNPDLYIIIDKLDDMQYTLVPAWTKKIPNSLLIWAKPTDIYVKSELCFKAKGDYLRKANIFTLKNTDKAIERIVFTKSKLDRRRRKSLKSKINTNNKQISKLADKLDIQQRFDFNKISNLKYCQGGRVSPK